MVQKRYKVSVSDDVYAARGYLAGDDDRRVEELMRAFRDPDVRAIWLARGGYGLTRILERLDASDLKRDPKLVIGYSDATALLFWLLHAAGLRGIHGPMVCHFGEIEAADQEWLFRMMESSGAAGRLPGAGAGAGAGNAGTGTVEGALLGGNLCLLSHLVGTPWPPMIGDGILFFEEIAEQPYAIDRFLTHLHSAGMLSGTRGALVGQLIRCVERTAGMGPSAEEVIAERMSAFGIPALSGFEFGHGQRRNLALPFGGRTRFDLAAGTVELCEAAVA